MREAKKLLAQLPINKEPFFILAQQNSTLNTAATLNQKYISHM